jgi:uncharacterized protein (TIGR03437 family)
MRIVRVSILFSFLSTAVSAQVTLNAVPTRVIGQDSVTINNLNPNLVEGREFLAPQGIALDTSTNPPALYVSDTTNNRVLGFRNAASFANGRTADLVLGQPDLFTTLAAGPLSKGRSTGLTLPSGIAVDSQGNVYVLDGGNNRILRYPKPFSQTPPAIPDIVLGQTSFSTNTANQGGISASTLAFTVTSNNSATVLQAFLTFDSAGNLWVSDSGNNRVLRFNASVLGSQASSGPAADVVLGQTDFMTGTYNPPPSNPALSLTSFTSPDGIAFDSAGRLFVVESISSRRGRILMWTPPFFTGEAASRLLGVDTATPPPAANSEFQMGPSPGALFPIGTGIGVADSFDSRVLVFPAVEQWTPNTTYQAAVEVAGQTDFTGGSPNQAMPAATASTLSQPAAAVFFNNELYVADSSNNRVVVMPQNGSSFGPATRVLGQDAMNFNAPNLVEGREFDFTSASGGGDTGVAVDLSANPPHLYVADTYNNRILGYKDLRNIGAGVKADIVIGQPNFQSTVANYPAATANGTSASGVFAPTGLVVDSAGNLYVADTGNGRVLRFPSPFANYTAGQPEAADLVLGQVSFTATKITDPTPRTMSEPYGLAFAYAGGLLVSDIGLNRVLYFQAPPLAPGQPDNFTSGMSASLVFGQPDFSSGGSGSGVSQLNSPHHISMDTDDHLYVADTGNSRVAIYDHAPTSSPGPPAAYFLTKGLQAPRGMYVSGPTGDIWVGDAGNGTAIRYPSFNNLIEAGGAPNATLSDAGLPLAMVEDTWGNLFLADAVNRVLIYYPGLAPVNAANYLSDNLLAPGMIAAMYSQGNMNQFGTASASATQLPLPTTLNGVQILFNGAPVPLFFAGPNQINFQVPMAAPQSGTVDLQVIEVATGRVLGDTTAVMFTAVPGLFTQTGNGIGTAVAQNQDGTLNTPTNPAVQGSTIVFYGTGQGYIAGAPPDGTISNAPLQSARQPIVIMGPQYVPSANIQYAGLSPGLVGVWQVNVLIPESVITTPTNPTQVVIIQDSVPSGGAALGRNVQIYVKSK